jgi:hypothetical protein
MQTIPTFATNVRTVDSTVFTELLNSYVRQRIKLCEAAKVHRQRLVEHIDSFIWQCVPATILEAIPQGVGFSADTAQFQALLSDYVVNRGELCEAAKTVCQRLVAYIDGLTMLPAPMRPEMAADLTTRMAFEAWAVSTNEHSTRELVKAWDTGHYILASVEKAYLLFKAGRESAQQNSSPPTTVLSAEEVMDMVSAPGRMDAKRVHLAAQVLIQVLQAVEPDVALMAAMKRLQSLLDVPHRRMVQCWMDWHEAGRIPAKTPSNNQAAENSTSAAAAPRELTDEQVSIGCAGFMTAFSEHGPRFASEAFRNALAVPCSLSAAQILEGACRYAMALPTQGEAGALKAFWEGVNRHAQASASRSVREALQRDRLSARFANRAPSVATADFDLIAPNDIVPQA